ncbi:MAG: immunoglobulin-like domain-containing protein [Velocimicrobium sp.]
MGITGKKKKEFSMKCNLKKGIALGLAILLAMTSALANTFVNNVAKAATGPSVILHYDMSRDTDGTIKDISGNDHNGTIPNASGVSYGTLGGDDYVTLSGGSAIEVATAGYITIPNGTIASDATSITVSMITKSKMGVKAGWLWALGQDNAGTGKCNYIYVTPRSYQEEYLRAGITGNNSDGDTSIIVDTSELTPNVWSVVTVTYQEIVGGAGTLTLYCDGVKIGQTAFDECNFAKLFSSTDSIDGYIGKSFWNDPYYQGDISDFIIYDGAMTEEQVTDLTQKSNQSIARMNESTNLILNYDMTVGTNASSEEVLKDISGNGKDAVLKGTYTKATDGTDAILSLSGGLSDSASAGYAVIPDGTFPTTLKNVSATIDIRLTAENAITWAWGLGSDSNKNFYVAPKSPHGNVLLAGIKNSDEVSASDTTALEQNVWSSITATFAEDGTLALYKNGKLVSKIATTNITTFGELFTAGDGFDGYIGKSFWPDPYFQGDIKEFKVYNKALSYDEVTAYYYDGKDSSVLQTSIEEAADALTLGEISSIQDDMTLPTTGINNTTISYSSSDPATIAVDGQVNRPDTGNGNKMVTLTAMVSLLGQSVTKTFDVTVLESNAEEDIKIAKETFTVDALERLVINDVTLPTTTSKKNVTVSWTSNDPAHMTKDGNVERPYAGNEDAKVTMTATFATIGSTATATKKFDVTVRAGLSDDDLAGYVYANFSMDNGKDVQQVHMQLSEDGLHWKALNGNDPLYEINQSLYPVEGTDQGIRDPYLIRGVGENSDKVWLLATDLNTMQEKYGGNLATSTVGNWGAMANSGSKNMFVWETTDWVNWERRWIDVGTEIKAGAVWAPEAIYNPEKDNYLVYWSARVKSDNFYENRIYCNETKDFKTFGPTKLYVDEDYTCIDASQLSVKEGESIKYYRLIKDERDNHINVEVSDTLLDPNIDYSSSNPLAKEVGDKPANQATGSHFTPISNTTLASYKGYYEGATLFKYFDRDEYCIMVDEYGGKMRRYIPFITKDLSKPDSILPVADGEYSMDLGCHGTMIPITLKEYNTLIKTYNQDTLKTAYRSINYIEADKRALNDTLASAKELKEGDYTAGSYQMLESAMTVANGFVADKSASSVDVAKSISSIQNAVKALVKKSDTGSTDFYGPVTTPKPTATPVPAPKKTSKVKAKNQTTSTIKLKWSKVSDITGYYIEKLNTAKNQWTQVAKITSNVASYVVTDLKTATDYTFRITAYKEGEEEIKGASTIIKTTTAAKNTKMKVKKSGTKAKITWTKVRGADGYAIFIKTGTGKYVQVKKIKSAKTLKYTRKGLKKGKKYTFKVVSYVNSPSGRVYSATSNKIKIKY